MNCRNGEQGHASALSSTQHPHPQPNGSNLRRLTPASWLCNSLIRRRYGGGVGNRYRWVERFAMSEQMQSMEKDLQRSRELFPQTVGDHAPREWEDPQAKRSGGMERSGSLCGRVAAPRETMYGTQCGSIGKQVRVSKSGPDVPDC